MSLIQQLTRHGTLPIIRDLSISIHGILHAVRKCSEFSAPKIPSKSSRKNLSVLFREMASFWVLLEVWGYKGSDHVFCWTTLDPCREEDPLGDVSLCLYLQKHQKINIDENNFLFFFTFKKYFGLKIWYTSLMNQSMDHWLCDSSEG